MASSPNLGIPYVEQGQSQKEVTMNEAITILDAVIGGGVLDKDLSTPPGSPVAGSRYIIGPSPTGAWAGKANQIAYYFSGGWRYIVPGNTWFLWVADEGIMYAFNGTAWVVASVSSGGTMFGINTTPDTTNRLSVNSDAVLLNHNGTSMQCKVNKNAAGNSASFLFQTGFSGRAEFGTLGDDNFTLKSSPDGSTWLDVIKMMAATGRVALKSIGAGQTAAGTNQGTAFAIVKSLTEFTTVAASTGGRLPTPEPGEIFMVANKGANALAVYPPSGAIINALAANTALSVAVGTARLFIAISATQYYSI